MPFQPPPRRPPVLASALATAGIVLTVAGCSHITPLGPDRPPPVAGPPTAVPVVSMPALPHHLRSPFVLEAVRVQPSTRASGCPAGSVALSWGPGRCYRKLGKPVTVTSATVSNVVSTITTTGQYGFMLGLPTADLPALRAITTTAADAHAYLDISMAGRTWLLPRVLRPFTTPLQIVFPSRNQVLQLHRLLVPSG